MEKKKTMVGALDLLIKNIEALGHVKVDDADKEPPLDMAAERRKDAREAALEIERERRQRRNDYVNRVQTEDRINPSWKFDRITVDSANRGAVELAQGFCALPKSDTLPVMLLLQGGSGSGKTVLAHCVANACLENSQDTTVELISFSRMFTLRHFTKDEKWEYTADRREHWNRLVHSSILILEDLCQDMKGLGVFEQQIFSDILRERKTLGLSLVITTALPVNTIKSAIGERCYESMKEYSVMAQQLLGPSRRPPIFINGISVG
ncbi:MAG: hypothetical protein J6M93_04150 [Succinivibrio sp.]|nr:hypothetical protein [Succinivibrio sp.]